MQKNNSDIVKDSGKEMYARLFLEKVEAGEALALTRETKKNFENIFIWLYEKFGL